MLVGYGAAIEKGLNHSILNLNINALLFSKRGAMVFPNFMAFAHFVISNSDFIANKNNNVGY